MSDPQALRLHLMQVLEALERIPRRFNEIQEAEDFLASDEGVDRLDAICMMLIAVGEAFKQIDRKTGGQLLPRYPEVDWVGVKGCATWLLTAISTWTRTKCLPSANRMSPSCCRRCAA